MNQQDTLLETDQCVQYSTSIMSESARKESNSAGTDKSEDSATTGEKDCDKETPSAPEVDKKALKEQFEAYGKFGDKAADGKTIKLSQSDKWFKQAKVIDGKTITTTDTGIAFRKISK